MRGGSDTHFCDMVSRQPPRPAGFRATATCTWRTRRAAPLRGHRPAPAVHPGRPTPPEPPGQRPGLEAAAGAPVQGLQPEWRQQRPGSDTAPDERGIHEGRKRVSKPCGASVDGGVGHGDRPQLLQAPASWACTRGWEPSGRTRRRNDIPRHTGAAPVSGCSPGSQGLPRAVHTGLLRAETPSGPFSPSKEVPAGAYDTD